MIKLRFVLILDEHNCSFSQSNKWNSHTKKRQGLVYTFYLS